MSIRDLSVETVTKPAGNAPEDAPRDVRRRAPFLAGLLLVAAAVAAVVAAAAIDARALEPAGVVPSRVASLRLGSRYDRVSAALGTTPITSDVYRGGRHVLQCWYYDLSAATHWQLCFDNWRLIAKEPYR